MKRGRVHIQKMLFETNPLPSDEDITFQSDVHVYYVKGRKALCSVTKIVSGAFPPFDAMDVITKNADKWRRDPKSEYCSILNENELPAAISIIQSRWSKMG